MDEDSRTFHIYVDETSKSERYFGVGAIFCRRDAAEEIAAYMSGAVVTHGQRPDKEIHWTELKNHLFPLYLEVGTKLISFTQRPPKMRFRVMMVESRHIDRSLDPKANREDILAKFIFTLVYQFAKDFGPNLGYHVFIDSPHGEEGQSDALFYALNNECKFRLGYDDQPFRNVKYIRSEKSRLIQATDLLAGAVAYETNGNHLAPNPAEHRRLLWSQMLTASRLKSFAKPTTYWPPQFQIRHFDFSKSKFTRFGAQS